jgi:fructokinase
MRVFGGIEAGGTKFVCGYGTGPQDLQAETQFPTTSPQETINRAVDFFRQQPEPIRALGIGSFGPLDLDPDSPAYGSITTTPKPGWQNTPLTAALQQALAVPVLIDTDVNAAALGEHHWGAAEGLDAIIYVTVGTGIGGGAIAAGKRLHGRTHPEMGHVRIPHDMTEDPFEGICPFHGDCLEGLASGPAIRARWGQAAETLPAGHPAWALEAAYLGDGLANLILTLSPQRVILGGGVMQAPGLLPLVRARVKLRLGGYLTIPEITEDLDAFIVQPALGVKSGVLGAIALAQEALEE